MQFKMKGLLFVLLIALTLTQEFYSNQQGSNIINICHCDLTTNFCDYNCCCDPDCSTSVINGLKTFGLYCQNNTMLTYCLDPSYFAKINVKPHSTTQLENSSIVCYDFNNTKNDQPQVEMSQVMVEQTVSGDNNLNVQASTQTYYSAGYAANKPFLNLTAGLAINGGPCDNVTTGNTSFYFKTDTTITCTVSGATQCQNDTIPLFKNFFSQNINAFLGQPTLGIITTPSSISANNPNNLCLNKMSLLVFYSKLGVQNDPLYYIIDTRFAQSYGNTFETYTMEIKFVEYQSLREEMGWWSVIGAPFFPMIPQDMFYPLVYNGEKVLGVTIVLLGIFL